MNVIDSRCIDDEYFCVNDIVKITLNKPASFMGTQISFVIGRIERFDLDGVTVDGSSEYCSKIYTVPWRDMYSMQQVDIKESRCAL